MHGLCDAIVDEGIALIFGGIDGEGQADEVAAVVKVAGDRQSIAAIVAAAAEDQDIARRTG
jgi:hypothetical protein